MNLSGLKRGLIPEFPKVEGRINGETGQIRYDKIWRGAVLATVSVSILPLVILAVWNFFQYQKSLKAEIIYPVHNLVSNAKGSFLLFLDERKSALKFIIHDIDFESLSNRQRLSSIFLNLKVSLGDIVDLGVITSDGTQVSYIGPYNLEGFNYKNERWFKEVIIKGEYISDVFLGFRDFPHIVIAIKRDYGDGFYVLRTTLDTQKFNAIVDSIHLRPTSDAFLVNDEGIIQTPTRYHGRVLEKINLSIPPASAQSEVSEMKDWNGSKIITGYTRIEGTPFTFVVVKQYSELMGSLEGFIGKLIGFLALSIIVIVIVIFRISTIMVNNIQEADRKRIKMLHEIEYTAKMASVGRLAAGVAHEINNPLAIVNEKAGMLKDVCLASQDLANKDQFLKLADSILNSVKRCSNITSRLLSFARHIDVKIEQIDLYQLMEEVLSFTGKETEYRNILVNLNKDTDVPLIRSDRGQLQQVFLNIINNAFAAVSDGGRIDIDIRNEGPDNVSVSIEDNGIGIRKEDLNRIFEPFFTTKGRQGSGLGLSITYGIIQKLRGDIKVKSEVNKGTKFTVTLPLNR